LQSCDRSASYIQVYASLLQPKARNKFNSMLD
jgi:hypothetical protein